MILEVKIDLFCVEKGVNRMDREDRWRAIPDKNSKYISFIEKTTFHVLCSCGWKQMFRFAEP